MLALASRSQLRLSPINIAYSLERVSSMSTDDNDYRRACSRCHSQKLCCRRATAATCARCMKAGVQCIPRPLLRARKGRVSSMKTSIAGENVSQHLYSSQPRHISCSPASDDSQSRWFSSLTSSGMSPPCSLFSHSGIRPTVPILSTLMRTKVMLCAKASNFHLTFCK